MATVSSNAHQKMLFSQAGNIKYGLCRDHTNLHYGTVRGEASEAKTEEIVKGMFVAIEQLSAQLPAHSNDRTASADQLGQKELCLEVSDGSSQLDSSTSCKAKCEEVSSRILVGNAPAEREQSAEGEVESQTAPAVQQGRDTSTIDLFASLSPYAPDESHELEVTSAVSTPCSVLESDSLDLATIQVGAMMLLREVANCHNNSNTHGKVNLKNVSIDQDGSFKKVERPKNLKMEMDEILEIIKDKDESKGNEDD